jgi:hypothetical protein
VGRFFSPTVRRLTDENHRAAKLHRLTAAGDTFLRDALAKLKVQSSNFKGSSKLQSASSAKDWNFQSGACFELWALGFQL